MTLLTRDDLYSLEQYAEQRVEMRAAVMGHKKNRQLPIGPHATLYFEDKLTMQYQIQEMLRVERIYEAGAIQEELDAYNPLIPDGSNWKATFMIEYTDVVERQQALTQLVGIEQRVWMQVQGFDPVYAIADEDLERADEQKTSAVHFLRFELSAEMAEAVRTDADINAGIDHHNYTHSSEPIPHNIRDSLAGDLS
ncbi:MAG: DUF3501 family protein [Pseudomonadota bacterium]